MIAKEFWREVPAFQAYNESKGLAQGSIVLYGKALRSFYTWFIEAYGKEATITPRRIREWMALRLAGGNARATVSVYIDSLRSFYNFLVLDEIIPEDKNPMRLVKRPRVPIPEIRPLSIEEIKRLLASFDRGNVTGFRDYMMCVLILDTGMRAGEITSLTIEDVDFEQSRIRVNGKGGKIRFVYMGQTAKTVLSDYTSNCRRWLANGDMTLFPSAGPASKHSRLQPKYLSMVIREKMQDVGIAKGYSSAHRLRHTFAVNFLRGHGGVFQLQKLLGHSTLNMTRRYVMLAEDDLAEAHRKASPIDRMGLG